MVLCHPWRHKAGGGSRSDVVSELRIDLQTDVNLAIDEPAQAHVGMQSTSRPTTVNPNTVPVILNEAFDGTTVRLLIAKLCLLSSSITGGRGERRSWQGSGQPLINEGAEDCHQKRAIGRTVKSEVEAAKQDWKMKSSPP